MDVFLSDGTQAYLAPLDESGLEQSKRKSGLEGEIYRRISALAYANVETIREGTPRHWRRCGGYNLDRFIDGVTFRIPQDTRFNLATLVSGAEGTLAVINETKLNIVRIPKKSALAIVHYDDLFTALSSVPILLETGPTAVELMDHIGLMGCRNAPEYARLLTTFTEGDPNCILITEFVGETDAELQSKLDHLKQHIAAQGVWCDGCRRCIG